MAQQLGLKETMMRYTPFEIAETDPLGVMRSADYRRFLRDTVLASGLALLADRRARRPSYPFVDTKFNPNTGADYPDSQYDVVFTWFLGRGSEACTMHLGLINSIEGLGKRRDEIRGMLQRYTESHNEAILEILRKNGDRIPFRVNRDLRGIDASGRPVALAAERCNASELFCAKALVAGGRPGELDAGVGLLRRFIDKAFANGYEDDTAAYPRTLHAESPFMLSMGAIAHLVRAARGTDRNDLLDEWAALTARMLDYELDVFYEPDPVRFVELVNFETKAKEPSFLPGHASELVGLALQAIDSLESDGRQLAAAVATTFARAKRELVKILLRAFELGYDAAHHGIRQEVDARSGAPRSTDLPWWSLPETMRAAARALLATEDRTLAAKLLDIYRRTSNDYFRYYPNAALGLFPFRTRSGETGEVKNLMPVVPEADPLYHTNLAVIDVLSMIGRLA